MTTTALDLLIGLVLIVYICARQLRWRPVDPSRMWRLPVVLGAAGVVSMSRQATTVHTVDVVILALSAAFALTSGVVMGRIARFRRSPADPGVTESRTGWLGVGIWLCLIALRVVLDVIGHRMGSDLGVATGTILVVLALNRAASAFVISARQSHRSPARAGN